MTTLDGRVLWYNSLTQRLVFDQAPDGVANIEQKAVYKSKSSKSKINKKNDRGELSLKYYQQRPITPYENEDVVEGLLQFTRHKWKFNNDLVNVYRAEAYRRDHKLPDPKQYCFPGMLKFLLNNVKMHCTVNC